MQAVMKHQHEQGGGATFWTRSVPGAVVGALREHLGDLASDLRYAVRTLRRRPAFLLIAVVSLGVGIGASTTVVATLDEVFFESIKGVDDQRRLINVKIYSDTIETFDLLSWPDYSELAAAQQQAESSASVSQLAAFGGSMLSVSTRAQDPPQLHLSQVVSANYFSTLGVGAQRGRLFSPDEDSAAQAVVVVTDWLWRTRMGGPELEPGTLSLNGETFQVVGVTEPGFRGHFKGFASDLFLPVGRGEVAGMPPVGERSGRFFELIGRLAPGADEAAAAADFARQGQLLASSYPEDNGDLSLVVEKLTGVDADFRGGLAVFLFTFLGLGVLILMVASLNVASLMTTRALARRHELDVRFALGAPRRRVARQLLVEASVVAGLAAALGIVLARQGARMVSEAFASVDARVDLGVDLDIVSLSVTAALAVLVALLCGLGPGMAASKHSFGRLRSKSGSEKRGLWRAAVVTQVVLTVVVLVVAMLFARALQLAGSIDPGFDPDRVLAVSIDPRLARMEDDAARALLDEARRGAGALAGVESVAMTTRLPLTLGARFFPNPITVAIPGHQPPEDQDGFHIESAVVSGGYFETMGIERVQGETFSDRERRRDSSSMEDSGTRGARQQIVVNEQFVRRFFDGGPVLGRALRAGQDELEIVGVVADSRVRTLDEAPQAMIYLSFEQRDPGRGIMLMRSARPPETLSGEVRALIRGAAPELPIRELSPLTDQLASAFLPQRVGALASGALGLIGLFLSTIGLYGVLVHSVQSRTREIGLRSSLGAAPSSLWRLIVGEGARLAVLGLALGVPLALGVAMLVAGFLYGVSPLDGWTYLAVALALLVVATLASAAPALRAMRIDPLEALRAP